MSDLVSVQSAWIAIFTRKQWNSGRPKTRDRKTRDGQKVTTGKRGTKMHYWKTRLCTPWKANMHSSIWNPSMCVRPVYLCVNRSAISFRTHESCAFEWRRLRIAVCRMPYVWLCTGRPKKVSHFQESSLNRIKNRLCGYISHQFWVQECYKSVLNILRVT